MKSILLLTVFICACFAPPAIGETIDLPGGRSFQIDVPPGWKLTRSEAGNSGLTVSLKPANGANAECLLSLMFPSKPQSLDKQSIEAEVVRICASHVDGSVEKKAVPRSFSVKQGYGAYCVLTDASLVGQPPRKGDYKVMGTGMIRFSEHIIAWVTVFSDEKDSDDFRAMLRSVSTSRVDEK